MRPHLLELHAFGAFPGRVRLDLEELGRSGLVLFCGDTGGGKTTLLDAMGYALFGEVPGERAKARGDLRSHHAGADDKPFVRLEFTARGQRLRVTRTPRWERPKSRGAGTTTQQPSALLERWEGGAWVGGPTRLDDVGLEVGRLVGMTADQFFQVVLLPQGRFAAFLQAKHDDREALLKKLFHVRRFEGAERWLAEHAATAQARVTTALEAVTALVHRVAQEAGAEAGPAELAEASSWCGALASDAAAERLRATVRVAELDVARRQAAAELQDAERLAERQALRRQAETERAGLRQQVPAMGLRQHELTAAERAVPVAVAASAADSRQRELALAGQLWAEAAEQVPSVLPGEPGGEQPAALRSPGALQVQDASWLAARAGWARTESGRVQALRQVALEAEAAARSAAEQRAGSAVASVALETARSRAAELPALLVGAEARVEQAQGAELSVPGLQARLDEARALAQSRSTLRTTETQLAAAEASLVETAAAREQARERAREVRNERLDAALAEIASYLEHDTPCPVCGSLDHPDVTDVSGVDAGRAAEQAAERAAQQADEAHAQAARDVARLQERCTGLVARLPAGEPADVATLHEELNRARADAAQLPARREALTSLRGEGERLAGDLARAEVELREHDKRAAEAHERVAELRARLDRELGPGNEPAARLDELSGLVRACEAAARAAEVVLAADRLATDAAAVLRQRAVEAGFATPQDATAADRPLLWREQTRAELEDHHRRFALLDSRLASNELDVPLEPAAAVPAAREAAEGAGQAHERAVRDHSLVAARAERLAALQPQVEAALETLTPLQQLAQQTRGLADVAAGRGQNSKLMSLSTYVLAARLEQVAEAASTRLARMSAGRFTLLHQDTGADRRSRAGLGLQVDDAWTGQRRDTSTLSGGETFMTALSLALGLADVVTAEAGGQTIDALFVDEGFGSLDADSLDRVMSNLDELRSSGRLVGLVSHVADLRDRIPTQVRVHKTPQGSTVETVSGL